MLQVGGVTDWFKASVKQIWNPTVKPLDNPIVISSTKPHLLIISKKHRFYVRRWNLHECFHFDIGIMIEECAIHHVHLKENLNVPEPQKRHYQSSGTRHERDENIPAVYMDEYQIKHNKKQICIVRYG
jgi:hypothetical protein